MVKNKGQQMKRGFTLLELLFVLLILGILVGVAMPRYIQSTKVAKQIAFESNLNDIIKALEKYKIQQQFQNFAYPSSLDVLKGKFAKEPINPYTGKSMLSSNSADSGILYQPVGTSYKLCVVQCDVDDVNNNSVVEEVLPLSTKTACIGNTQTSVGVTFARPSVAYTSNGAQVGVDIPRFEQGKFDRAIMIEEGTTNLLRNPSFETGDLSDWSTGFGLGITGNASIVTSPVFHGNYAVKIKIISSTFTSDASVKQTINFAAGTTITVSAYLLDIQGDVQAELTIRLSNGQGEYQFLRKNFTNHGRCVFTVTVPTGYTADQIWINMRPKSVGGVGHVIWDAVQLEAKPYATSFIDGTRAAETLTIPTAGVLNPQEGTIECWLPAGRRQYGTNMQFIFDIGGTGASGAYLAINTDGRLIARLGDGFTLGPALSPTTVLDPNQTYYIALKWWTGYFAISINGVTTTLARNHNFTPYTNMHIGSDNGALRWLDGLIDDLRISSRARTDAEILAAYQSGQPLPVDAWTTLKADFNGNLDMQSGIIQ